MGRILLTLLFFCFHQFLLAADERLEVYSPGKKNKLEIKLEDGQPSYRILRKNNELLGWSKLGLKLKGQSPYMDFKMFSSERRKYSNVWKPLWEKVSSVKNEYAELRAVFQEDKVLSRSLTIVFRVYDDGVAWYYELPLEPNSDSIVVEADKTSFNLPGSGTWWSFNGERKNLGPCNVADLPQTVQTPFLYKNSPGQFIAIAEAEIRDMANFTMKKSDKSPGDLSILMDESILKLPGRTSWRVVMTGDSESDLIESNLIINLNPPTAIADVSWIKPGKSTWNWRGWGYKTASGYEYKIDTESQKRFIDFAAKNNIQYHLIDANWYGPEFDSASDPSIPNPDFNVQEILAYAKKSGVGVFLYLNDVGAKKYGLERVLKQFHDWGAVGIKYGFMRGNGQSKVLHTKNVIALCAKYKLMLFFHDDPIPPSGDHVTWPHVLAREYGHAQADGKFSVYPESSINQPFINMLVGPLDMNFGWFDLTEAIQRTKVGEAVPGTVAGEIARMAAIFSGFVCLPDVPEEYMAKPEMFEFIRRFPVSFDEYKVLDAEIDNYFSVARRSGDNWVVASMTNQEARKESIKLSFLQKGKKYKAYLYEDAEDSHYLNNKEAYKIGNRMVKRGDLITAVLAPGGGHSIYLEMIP